MAAVLGIWHLPDRMYPGNSDGAVQARAALQGGLLTAAAALTAVAGGLIALDETRHANAEVRRANEETRRANEAADSRERDANANTHVRELYTRAVDQLGTSDNETVRLGGIYALERIAIDSPADQRTVVEVLSAFVRIRSTDSDLRQAPAEESDALAVRPAADIRAAVQVLARLPVRDDVPRCDLSGANLNGPASLAAITLTGTNLAGADLDEADLTSARMGGVDLTGASLKESDLTGAQMGAANLTRTRLDWAILTDARLANAILADAQLGGARLVDALLDGAVLVGAQLGGADLTDARLVRADLTNARLVRTNFTDARLGEADLTGAQMRGAKLVRTRLDGADLTGAVGLDQTQLDVAEGDAETRLPAGLVRPASWTSGGTGGA
nr:pentapeptide repeat-containing protein [Parafrankia colletiae]